MTLADVDPTIAEDLRQAITLHADGALEEAVAAYRIILAARPEDCACWSNLGVALRALGRKQEGLDVLREGSAACPNFVDLNYNLGNALAEADEPEAALERYLAALKVDPNNLQAILSCGAMLERLERFEVALDHFRVASRRRPDSMEIHHELGRMLWNLRKLDAAVAAYRRAISLGSAPHYYRINLELALAALGRYAEGEAELRTALAQTPNDPDTLAALGQNFTSQGRLDDALELCEAAITFDPDHLVGRLGRVRANLLAGNLLQGWLDYGWHRRRNSWQPPDIAGTQWTGEDINGQTILLYGEQGLGDIIHFARYAELVAARGARVWFYAPPALVGLIESVKGIERVYSGDQPPPTADKILPVMDLPRLFGTELASIPATLPYIFPNPPPGPTLPPTQQFRIGIVWAGNPVHERDRDRSCNLEAFAPLLERPDVEFFSLQVGLRADDLSHSGIRGLVTPLGHTLSDFTATANLLAELDLLITVDTAVAHLAGALGRPVWTLLAYAPDWRWMLGRSDTPWYPTMRLFRQPEPNDWSGVFHDVNNELDALMLQRRDTP